MATRPANMHPFYEAGLPSLVGVLVSILLGYAVVSVENISEVFGGGVIGWFAAILIAVNVFRIAHGLIIAMRDPRYDTQVGGDFNLADMARCVLVMLAPFLSLQLIVRLGPLDSEATPDTFRNFLLILWYMLPHIVYLVWDLRLGFKLKRNGTGFSFVDCVTFWRCKLTSPRPNSYASWVPVWLFLDVVIILVLALLLALSLAVMDGVGESTLKGVLTLDVLLVVFAVLSAGSMFCDYMWLNRRYYFPRDC